MVNIQITNVAYLGEGAGPEGQIRNWQVRFAINGPGLSTIVEVPSEAPMHDVAGWQAEKNALARLRAFLRAASKAADNMHLG
jgi:hypothetical protein